MQPRKKLPIFLIILTLIITLLMGCTANTTSSSTEPISKETETTSKAVASAQTNNQTAISSQEPDELNSDKIAPDPITLTYFINFDPKASATIQSYAEQDCYVYLEELTGVHIEFIHPPAEQVDEKFNLMVSSGDLADLIWRWWWGYPGGPGKAIDDGVIIDIKPYMNEYAPNMTQIMEEDPQIRKDMTTDDGRMYYFTFLHMWEWKRHTEGFMLRQDWLDRLNLKTPVTMDDWYDVLTAIKEQDANGNDDVNDEIPFVTSGIGGLHRFIPAYGILREFYLDPSSGKIEYGSIQPAYKDHVAEMTKWYKEGLIDADFAATDGKSFTAKITGNQAGSFGGFLAGNMSTFMGLMQNDPEFQLVGSKWPTVDTSKPNYNPSGIAARAPEGSGVGISPTNKYPEQSVRWIDFQYSGEGHLAINFGREGLAYDMVDGKPVLKDFILNDPDLSPVNMLSKYGQCPIWNSYIQDPDGFTQILKYPGVRETADVFADSDKTLQLPPLTPNFDEAQKINSIMADIRTYVDENYMSWITGTQTLDNYDAYTQAIKDMGIDEVIAIYEEALNRYNAREIS